MKPKADESGPPYRWKYVELVSVSGSPAPNDTTNASMSSNNLSSSLWFRASISVIKGLEPVSAQLQFILAFSDVIANKMKDQLSDHSKNT